MGTILKIERLSKTYNTLRTVCNLSLKVDKGQAFGLIGPNGSGKTTLLSMIAGVIPPTSGHVYWFGNRAPHQAMSKVGAIIEGPAFYPYMSGQKNLELSACIRKKGYHRIGDVLDLVELTKFKNYKYKTYSLGMKQRLAIASSLLHNPEVLILDEPTNGLDPIGINSVRAIIQHVIESGKTVILASHLLDEVEKICSHFAVLNHGKLIHNGSIKSIKKDNEEVEVGTEQGDIMHVLKTFAGAQSIIKEGKHYILTMKPRVTINDLNHFFTENKIVITHLTIRKKTLEKKFIDILQKAK